MNFLCTLTISCALASPVLASETLITKQKTTDAVTIPGQEKPAETQTELTWIGKDKLRVDLGVWTTIVRRDQGKLYQLNNETKAYSVVELPVDLSSYLTPPQKKALDRTIDQVEVTVTPTSETRKFENWNATKYVLSMTVPRRGTFTEEIWAANDVGFDTSAWTDMWSARMQLQPVGGLMAKEQKKIVGFPVFVERKQALEGRLYGGRDQVLSIESKDAPEGTFDVPKDYVARAFDLEQGAMREPPPVKVELLPVPPETPPTPPSPK